MPEGPELKIQADQLHEILNDKELLSITWDDRSKYRKSGIEGYEEFQKYLPSKILRVTTKGKKLIFHLDNDLHIVSSLGLEGHWLTEKRKHSNLQLNLSDGSVIYFDDTRHFGSIELFLFKELLDERLSEIGPDLLSEEVSFELFKTRITKSQKKQICQVLMDQKYVAGIGNYLKAEILYASKIRPDRLIKDLSENDLKLLYENSISIIKRAYESHGMTSKSYVDVYGNNGVFKCIVYMQKEDSFGNPVRTNTFNDKRTTHWVEEVQI